MPRYSSMGAAGPAHASLPSTSHIAAAAGRDAPVRRSCSSAGRHSIGSLCCAASRNARCSSKPGVTTTAAPSSTPARPSTTSAGCGPPGTVQSTTALHAAPCNSRLPVTDATTPGTRPAASSGSPAGSLNQRRRPSPHSSAAPAMRSGAHSTFATMAPRRDGSPNAALRAPSPYPSAMNGSTDSGNSRAADAKASSPLRLRTKQRSAVSMAPSTDMARMVCAAAGAANAAATAVVAATAARSAGAIIALTTGGRQERVTVRSRRVRVRERRRRCFDGVRVRRRRFVTDRVRRRTIVRERVVERSGEALAVALASPSIEPDFVRRRALAVSVRVEDSGGEGDCDAVWLAPAVCVQVIEAE